MLKTRGAVLVLGATLGAAFMYAGGWFWHSVQMAAARTESNILLVQQEKAWNDGDLAGFLSYYQMNEDITFFSDDRVSKGWVSLSDRYTKKYGGGKAAMGKLAFDDLDFTVLAPNAVQVRGRWTTSDTPNAGTGLFTILVCKTENGWKVVHDHTSAKKPENK